VDLGLTGRVALVTGASRGIGRAIADALAIPAAEWEDARRALVVSPMLIMGRVVPGMRERGFGRVVAVSPSTAVEPIAGLQLSTANRPGCSPR
jgi:3-oxoacyl-[acyl-carrier protein] reductase